MRIMSWPVLENSVIRKWILIIACQWAKMRNLQCFIKCWSKSLTDHTQLKCYLAQWRVNYVNKFLLLQLNKPTLCVSFCKNTAPNELGQVKLAKGRTLPLIICNLTQNSSLPRYYKASSMISSSALMSLLNYRILLLACY